MGKIVLYTNPKGGVGKSCLCGIFANYLSQMGMKVAVIDADVQQSLFRHRKRDLQGNPEARLPWDIRNFQDKSPEQVANILTKLKALPYVIAIDCPGNIIDPMLKVIYPLADIAVVPFHYDSDSLDATKMFCDVFKNHYGAKMFFVPNGIVVAEERRESLRQERDKAIETLKCYGFVTPRVKRTVIVGDYSTLITLDYCQKNAVKYAFEPIINELQKGGVE